MPRNNTNSRKRPNTNHRNAYQSQHRHENEMNNEHGNENGSLPPDRGYFNVAPDSASAPASNNN